MGRILVGTASWTDKSLLESGWYPPEANNPDERLRFYASQYPLVEVDSTYYAPPSESTAKLWAERTPDGFTFNVKAFSLLTQHPTKPGALYKDLRPDTTKNVYLKDFAAADVDVAATSGDLAVVRFHGHNDAEWESGSVQRRFAYLYSEQELKTWVPKLEELSGQAKETHVLMNNCHRDYAQRNATQLIGLLS